MNSGGKGGEKMERTGPDQIERTNERRKEGTKEGRKLRVVLTVNTQLDKCCLRVRCGDSFKSACFNF
jgi:hypothetical protein